MSILKNGLSDSHQGELISSLEGINIMLSKMQELSSCNFLPLTKKINEYQKAAGIQEFQEKYSDNLKWVSVIISELQFHDIIRQKLEHIEEIHVEMISEMKQSKRWNNVGEPKYLHIIPQLMKLSAAQLLRINQEFISAMSMLESCIALLKKKDVTLHDGTVHNTSPDSFVGVSMIVVELLNSLMSELVAKPAESLKHLDFRYIESIYTMQSERDIFNKVFGISVAEADPSLSKLKKFENSEPDFF